MRKYVKWGVIALALGAVVLIVPEVVQAQQAGGACYTSGGGEACGGVPDADWMDAFLALMLLYLLGFGGALVSWI